MLLALRTISLFSCLLFCLNSNLALAKNPNKPVKFYLKFKQGFVATKTDDPTLYFNHRISTLRTTSTNSQLGFELVFKNHLGFEIDSGLHRLFFTQLYKSEVNRYFLATTAKLNYHILPHGKNFDPYFTSGTHILTNFSHTQLSYLFAFGFAHHFKKSPWQVFFEPGVSSNFAGTTLGHVNFGVGLQM